MDCPFTGPYVVALARDFSLPLYRSWCEADGTVCHYHLLPMLLLRKVIRSLSFEPRSLG